MKGEFWARLASAPPVPFSLAIHFFAESLKFEPCFSRAWLEMRMWWSGDLKGFFISCELSFGIVFSLSSYFLDDF